LWRAAAPEAPPDPTAAADLALLRDLVHSLLKADRVEEAYQFAIDRTAPAVGAALAAVFVTDGESELMHLAAAHGWPDRWRPWLGEMRVRVGFGPSGEAVSERRLIEVPDVYAGSSGALEDWQDVAGELGFRALVALPLVADTVRGAVSFYFSEAGARTPRVRDLLRAVADVMAAMAEKESLLARLRHAEAALEASVETSVEASASTPVPPDGVQQLDQMTRIEDAG
jgi:hypothetical protein